MFRTTLAAVALSVITSVVLAQSGLVAARKDLMNRFGEEVDGVLRDMVRGTRRYDQAEVDAIFAHLAGAAQKLPALYAESTRNAKPSGRYNVSPKLWENRADFDARAARFASAVAAARPRATSLEGLKEAHGIVRPSCSDCHNTYRVRN